MSVDRGLIVRDDGLGDVLLGVRDGAGRVRGEGRVEPGGGDHSGGDGTSDGEHDARVCPRVCLSIGEALVT